MRLPVQAPPVSRSMKSSRPPSVLVGHSSCWGTCMLSKLDFTDLSQCADTSKPADLVACIMRFVGGLDPATLLAEAAVWATYCGIDCI
jgi:hypothetical protein